SRWPKDLPFMRGYVLASEIVRAVADTPSGPYRFAGVVLPARGGAHWDGRMTHNPTILRVGGTYALFYIGSTYRGPMPEQELLWQTPPPAITPALPQLVESYGRIRIGLATAPAVTGPWTRADAPILTPQPGAWDQQLVTNPAPCLLPDGRLWLYYRSNTPLGLRLGVAAAEALGAPFKRLRNEPLSFCDSDHYVEDPFVWRSNQHFEMIAKDITGGFTGERHAGLHATSPDGLNWTPSTPPKAYSRTVQWDNGTTTVQGCLERPQLLLENGRPTQLFAATADGPGGFNGIRHSWNITIPLGEPRHA
ncbi:MAG: glycoside hydrolase family protein, partial [Candidatus Marinimicrobia bacterium]|nr:glycoside hydrolase family protein [Candidatus Neomarinimicrobiota bacterium]